MHSELVSQLQLHHFLQLKLTCIMARGTFDHIGQPSKKHPIRGVLFQRCVLALATCRKDPTHREAQSTTTNEKQRKRKKK
jgi:hypothetical protein